MKIVVIEGPGQVGAKVVSALHMQGHEAVAVLAVNALAGAAVKTALADAQVVIDVSSFQATAGPVFLEIVTRNLLAAAAEARVRHYVALSVVGADRLVESGRFRARIAQEQLIRESGVPYTIVRATLVFEFLGGIADAATVGGCVRLAPAFVQPIAAADVAERVASAALGAPVHGVVEVAGPEALRLDELVRQNLRARHDPRVVITDPYARYFGAALHVCTLVANESAHLGATHFADWLSQTTAQQ